MDLQLNKHLTDEELNEAFCEELELKKALVQVTNMETGEARAYSSKSSLYRLPVGWNNVETIEFDAPRYPDFINNNNNFCKLLNIHWFMFKHLGNQYTQNDLESFQYNYIETRLKAIQMCKSFGGGEMLEEYIKTVRNTMFDYTRWDDVAIEG